MEQKPYDEYEIGEVFESYGRTVTETDLVNFTCFAGLKLPLFIDEEFCRENSQFKTRIIPGLMTASIAAGMLEDILGQYTIAALGLDAFRFTAPVFPGDTLRSHITVEDKKDTSDGRRGVLTARITVFKQGEVPVLEFLGSFLMHKGRF
jgi:3-hydroxybutyryl-CoA dehydratase